MIITYNKNIDTSIKYDPLKIHFWVIGNVLCMKIIEQDERLRQKNTIIDVKYDSGHAFFEINSVFSPEIAKNMIYIKGDAIYDEEIASYSFHAPSEVKKYLEDIKQIFENINIFDTEITIEEINTNI